jgi:membrane glycosyltransferase
VLLLAPKAMSLLVILLRGRAWCYGGASRLIGSAFIEFFHSLLLAPVRMLFHTQFFIAALTGWKLEWKSPPRGDAATSWGEATRRHGLHTLFALVWIGAIHATGAPFPIWLSPIIVGLLAAIPLSVWGSRVTAGRRLERAGLLLIPEEIEPPLVLTEARRPRRADRRTQCRFRRSGRRFARPARRRHGESAAARADRSEGGGSAPSGCRVRWHAVRKRSSRMAPAPAR